MSDQNTHQSLPEMLAAQARSRPHETAVVCGDERLSFAELVERAGAVATHLEPLLTGSIVECVGLYVEQSIDLMVGAWGIITAGCAYVPLSPEYPDDRIRYMVDNSLATVVFTQEHLVERLRALVPATTLVMTMQDVGEASGAPARTVSPDALAYVIYTSGSTGRPKGVMIAQRSIASQMSWLASQHGIGPGTVVLQKTPMSFDAAQWEILAPGCGGRVVMGEPGCHRDPGRLLELIRRHGVNTLQCVPTLLSVLLDYEELAECDSLRDIYCGGEALSRDLAAECLTKLPDCRLVNLYGPTECTINSSSFTVDRAAVGTGSSSISIGFPAAGTKYHILDAAGAAVEGDAVGELYIDGVQVAQGYLRRPDLTAERFVDGGRRFRTGDLAHWNPDGSVQFMGRADNQVKVRGHRIELDEIRLAIEHHEWVRTAGVVIRDDPRTGFQNLVACVELNPREAALMDQGNAGAHHQSKASRVQVRAQLSGAGLRETTDPGARTIDLTCRGGGQRQREQAFARKTYRFYEGGPVTRTDLLDTLDRRAPVGTPRAPESLTLAELGDVLRYFGANTSPERLLPKYGYASPGSLYATQLFLEFDSGGPVSPGIYYYHPMHHQLVRLSGRRSASGTGTRVHLLGRTSAIAAVYSNNIREVLEIEAGHMIGLFDEVLAAIGLGIEARTYEPTTGDILRTEPDDHYLGTFALVEHFGHHRDEVDLFVQAHPGRVAGLPAGQYRYADGELEPVAGDLVLRKHVIAINQSAYERASVGVSLVSRAEEPWLRYVELGRAMQRLSMNDRQLGFMSSGYSSESGNDLPAATRISDILAGCGVASGPSYFFVGGRVSEDQWRSEGMKEDTVHMRGPAELIRDDLTSTLPDYMVPNKVIVLDAMPLTPNGKVDLRALERLPQTEVGHSDQPFVAPRTDAERRVAQCWTTLLRCDQVSVDDDFFASGGNSLIAVALINRINRDLDGNLPIQALFESPTVAKLAERVIDSGGTTGSRLIPLATPDDSSRPIFCWPGLGGYTMNLRPLAAAANMGRPLYGVQAHGINAHETPHATIEEMAAADIAALREVQPHGPYTLWGYSFGARVAFETAHRLEQAGEQVDNLFLIAPGSPQVEETGPADAASYGSATFIAIMFSVFAGSVTDPRIPHCLDVAVDDESFIKFVCQEFPDLPHDLVCRIVDTVTRTYCFRFQELPHRRIDAPVTIFRASGDDYSFAESGDCYSARPPMVVDVDADHYSLLKEPAVSRLASTIHDVVLQTEPFMPHVNIKHFPALLGEDRLAALREAISGAVAAAFGCPEDVVSVALEPVEQQSWNDTVYVPEILERRDLLLKVPNYASAGDRDAA